MYHFFSVPGISQFWDFWFINFNWSTKQLLHWEEFMNPLSDCQNLSLLYTRNSCSATSVRAFQKNISNLLNRAFSLSSCYNPDVFISVLWFDLFLHVILFLWSAHWVPWQALHKRTIIIKFQLHGTLMQHFDVTSSPTVTAVFKVGTFFSGAATSVNFICVIEP